MITKRRRKVQKGHYALFVNRTARGYSEKAVNRLVSAIHANKLSYTVYEPDSAANVVRQAEVAVGMRQANQALPRPYERGGKVTGLVACGGDGTFNLVARAALKAGLPVAHYPLGRLNNVAASFYGTTDPNQVIKNILSAGARASDAATVSGLPFFCSVGLGFAPQMLAEIGDRALPRLSIGWAKLGSAAASKVEPVRTVLKVDSFRFEITPTILNINILPYTVGLALTPASVPDDGQLEVVYDVESQAEKFASFTRLLRKKQYLFGDEFRLYRGQVIAVEGVAGRTLYLDGELVKLPTDVLEVKIDEKKLQVLC
jgi:diacylglycerol kinase (ATP)